MRLDIELVRRGKYKSRQKAKEAIINGRVRADGKICLKPSYEIDDSVSIETEDTENDFVGRGGHKLLKMLDKHRISLDGNTCMDIGASTGGFTQCMLRHGAECIYAVDVGTGQLAQELCCDSRVINMEKTDIRNVSAESLDKLPGFISADVSFISLKLILPEIYRLLEDDGKMICLIKPQFEAGKKNVGKKGIVRSPKVHISILEEIADFAEGLGFTINDVDHSPIQGGSGNIEYLMLAEKSNKAIHKDFDFDVIVERAFYIFNKGVGK